MARTHPLLIRALPSAAVLVLSLVVAPGTGAQATPPATPATVTPSPSTTPAPTSAVAPGAAPTTATGTPTGPAATPVGTMAPAAAAGAAGAPATFSSGVPCASDDPNAAGGVQRSERRGQDENGEGNPNEFATGNGRNEVVVHNCTDGRLRVRASIQLDTIPGQVVAPFNQAYAESSCANCQTLAVALQIALYSSQRAHDVRPENYAVALNSNCSHCFTVARAIQYVQPVDDPSQVPEDVARTVAELDQELTSIQSDPAIPLAEAEARLNSVLQRFVALGGTLGEQRDERQD